MCDIVLRTEGQNSLSRRSSTGSTAQQQVGRLNDAILKHFRDQPLAGVPLPLRWVRRLAPLCLIPNRKTLSWVMPADATREAVSAQASALTNQGKEIASDAYDKVVAIASGIHDATKNRVVEEADKFKT